MTDTSRSVYLPMYRSALPEVLEAFDAADPDFVTGDRDVTTVAPQALFMMNSPFVIDPGREDGESAAGTDAQA